MPHDGDVPENSDSPPAPRNERWTGTRIALTVVFTTVTVVTAILIAGGFYLAYQHSPAGQLRKDRANAAEFVKVARSIQVARERGSDPMQLQAVQAMAHLHLDSIIEEYNQTASTEYPYRQHLLWAGRDYLDGIFRENIDETRFDESMFMKHVEEARVELGLPGPPLEAVAIHPSE